MFGAVIRATLVLVAGAMILWALGPVSSELAEQNSELADPEYGDNSRWIDIISEWFPLVILATIAAMLIGGAVARRRLTGVRR